MNTLPEVFGTVAKQQGLSQADKTSIYVTWRIVIKNRHTYGLAYNLTGLPLIMDSIKRFFKSMDLPREEILEHLRNLDYILYLYNTHSRNTNVTNTDTNNIDDVHHVIEQTDESDGEIVSSVTFSTNDIKECNEDDISHDNRNDTNNHDHDDVSSKHKPKESNEKVDYIYFFPHRDVMKEIATMRKLVILNTVLTVASGVCVFAYIAMSRV